MMGESRDSSKRKTCKEKLVKVCFCKQRLSRKVVKKKLIGLSISRQKSHYIDTMLKVNWIEKQCS